MEKSGWQGRCSWSAPELSTTLLGPARKIYRPRKTPGSPIRQRRRRSSTIDPCKLQIRMTKSDKSSISLWCFATNKRDASRAPMDSSSAPPSPSPAPSGSCGASNATQRWSILRRALLARSSSARALGSADSVPYLPHAIICVRLVLSFIRFRFICLRRAIKKGEGLLPRWYGRRQHARANKEGPNAAPCAVDFSSRRLVSVLRFELLARYYTLWWCLGLLMIMGSLAFWARLLGFSEARTSTVRAKLVKLCAISAFSSCALCLNNYYPMVLNAQAYCGMSCWWVSCVEDFRELVQSDLGRVPCFNEMCLGLLLQ